MRSAHVVVFHVSTYIEANSHHCIAFSMAKIALHSCQPPLFFLCKLLACVSSSSHPATPFSTVSPVTSSAPVVHNTAAAWQQNICHNGNIWQKESVIAPCGLACWFLAPRPSKAGLQPLTCVQGIEGVLNLLCRCDGSLVSQ